MSIYRADMKDVRAEQELYRNVLYHDERARLRQLLAAIRTGNDPADFYEPHVELLRRTWAVQQVARETNGKRDDLRAAIRSARAAQADEAVEDVDSVVQGEREQS